MEEAMENTRTYIGTKIVRASPSKGSDGRDGYFVTYPNGYESWSPKAVFEAAYRLISPEEKAIVI